MTTRIETVAEFFAEAERLDPEGFARARAEKAERDALRKDAERYRTLRSRACKDGGMLVIEIGSLDDNAVGDWSDFIDETVDAMQASAAKEPQ